MSKYAKNCGVDDKKNSTSRMANGDIFILWEP